MPVFTAQVSMRSPALCARAVLRWDSLAGTGPVQRRQERRNRHVSHRVHARGQPRAAHVWLLTRRPVPAYVCAPCSMCARRGHLSCPARLGAAQPAMLVMMQLLTPGSRSSAHTLPGVLPGPCSAPGARRWTCARPRARWAARRAGPVRRRRSAAPPRAPRSAAACGPCAAGLQSPKSPARSQLHSESHQA